MLQIDGELLTEPHEATSFILDPLHVAAFYLMMHQSLLITPKELNVWGNLDVLCIQCTCVPQDSHLVCRRPALGAVS
jgi:hypothetical protein